MKLKVKKETTETEPKVLPPRRGRPPKYLQKPIQQKVNTFTNLCFPGEMKGESEVRKAHHYDPSPEARKNRNNLGRYGRERKRPLEDRPNLDLNIDAGIKRARKEALNQRKLAEQHLRDPVVGYGEGGKRIFAYNEKGQPICFSRRTNMPNDIRCTRINTMWNGRCALHGGKAPSGAEHWNKKPLRGTDALPLGLRPDMRRAGLDPDLASMDHEIKLADLHIANLTRNLESALSGDAEKRIAIMLSQLNSIILHNRQVEEDKAKTISRTRVKDRKNLSDTSSSSLKTTAEKRDIPIELLENIIEAYTNGKSTERTYAQIERTAEHRRKLSDYKHKREIDLKQMVKADQMSDLIITIVTACRDAIARSLINIEKRYILTDKDTKIIFPKVHPEVKEDFLLFIYNKLGKLAPSENMELLSSQRDDPTESLEYKLDSAFEDEPDLDEPINNLVMKRIKEMKDDEENENSMVHIPRKSTDVLLKKR